MTKVHQAWWTWRRSIRAIKSNHNGHKEAQQPQRRTTKGTKDAEEPQREFNYLYRHSPKENPVS